jgi:hypothetical protein
VFGVAERPANWFFRICQYTAASCAFWADDHIGYGCQAGSAWLDHLIAFATAGF